MAILNNVEHGELRYSAQFGERFGDHANRMQLFPEEFAEAQRDHPIIFAPDSQGTLVAMALLGFEKDENLHFNGQDWGGSYIPAIRKRGPFSIRLQSDGSGQETDMLVEVDLDDERIGTHSGAPLFKPHGGNSVMLDQIGDALALIYYGMQQTSAFVSALMQLRLLHDVRIDIELGDGRTIEISDHMVVDPERFARLEADELKALNDAGFLVPLVQAMGSVGNIQRLVDRKSALMADVG